MEEKEHTIAISFDTKDDKIEFLEAVGVSTKNETIHADTLLKYIYLCIGTKRSLIGGLLEWFKRIYWSLR